MGPNPNNMMDDSFAHVFERIEQNAETALREMRAEWEPFNQELERLRVQAKLDYDRACVKFFITMLADYPELTSLFKFS